MSTPTNKKHTPFPKAQSSCAYMIMIRTTGLLELFEPYVRRSSHYFDLQTKAVKCIAFFSPHLNVLNTRSYRSTFHIFRERTVPKKLQKPIWDLACLLQQFSTIQLKNLFQNGVNDMSRMVNIVNDFLSESSQFSVVRIVRFCSNFTSLW